jgi:hypothetical protein
MMDTTIELPALRRAAELAPGSVDSDARTVEVIWSTGARVRRVPFFGDAYDEELSLDPAHVRLERLNAGAPFLRVHELTELDSVIGSAVPGSARIENGRGIATIRFSERETVEPVWRDIQAGHIRAVSIGYQVHRYEVSKPEAGRELWRAVDWTPFEISAVPVGADPAAGFRSSENLHACVVHRAGADPNEERTSPMHDDDIDTEDANETVEEQEAPDAPAPPRSRAKPGPEMADEPRTPEPEALVAEARTRERERVATIYDLTSRFDLERGFADDLVKRGVALDEARRQILDTLADASEQTRTFPHVSVPLGGRDERMTRRDAVSNALLHRYSPTLFPLDEAAREYRGMTLMELARESLDQAGVGTRGMSRDQVATRGSWRRSPTRPCARPTRPIRAPSPCSAARCSPPTSRRCTVCRWARRRSSSRSTRAASSSAARSPNRRRAIGSRPMAGWSASRARS